MQTVVRMGTYFHSPHQDSKMPAGRAYVVFKTATAKEDALKNFDWGRKNLKQHHPVRFMDWMKIKHQYADINAVKSRFDQLTFP